MFRDENLRPGGRIYAVHLEDAPIYAWVLGPCASMPTDTHDLSLDDLGRYLSTATPGRLFLNSKVSGTRKRVEEYRAQVRDKDAWAKASALFDNNAMWGNSLQALVGKDRDKACVDEHTTCVAVGGFVDEDVSLESRLPEETTILQRHEGNRCMKKYVLCQDGGGNECPRLVDSLYLVGRAQPNVSSLDAPECNFIGSLVDSIRAAGQETVRAFAKAQCPFNDPPGDSLITWINGAEERSAKVQKR
jgi:hypothetical protein